MRTYRSLLPWRNSSVLPEPAQRAVCEAASLSIVDTKQQATLKRAIDLLAKLPPHAAPRAEREIRELWANAECVHPHSCKHLLPLSASRVLLNWPLLAPLFFGDRDGRIRQKALERTTSIPPGGFFLGLLVWQMNDWVKPVRDAAEACLTRCLPSLSRADLKAAMPLFILRFPAWYRTGSTAFNLPRILQGGRGLDVLREILMTEQTGPLPRMFKQVLRTDLVDTDLPALATTALHPQIRVHAAHCLLEGEARCWVGYGSEFDPGLCRSRPASRFDIRTLSLTPLTSPDRAALIRACATDRLPGLRKLAADRLIAGDCPALLPELLPLLLTDRNGAVRNRAEFLARKHC